MAPTAKGVQGCLFAGREKSDGRVTVTLLGQVFLWAGAKTTTPIKPTKLFMRRGQGDTYILAAAKQPLCIVLLV